MVRRKSFLSDIPTGMLRRSGKNDGVLVPRILRVLDFIPHLVKLNVNTVYFCPVFESSSHGYDPSDYLLIDKRLGSNEDFTLVCRILHENGIRVILDGIFNHVGRDFFAFRDVLEKSTSHLIKIGFISILHQTVVIMMAFGMKDGRGILSL